LEIFVSFGKGKHFNLASAEFFGQNAADENNFVFGVKMVSYILHTRFLHSPLQAKKFGVFVG
jgi:hypothetical protein